MRARLRHVCAFAIVSSAILAAVVFTVGACTTTRPSAEDPTGPPSGARPDGGGQQLDGGVLGDDGGVSDASVAEDSRAPKACLGDKADGGAGSVCPVGACEAACTRIMGRYKAGVAQAAVLCIEALPSCSVAAEVVPCVDKALADACEDPSAASYCAPLVTNCDPAAGDSGSAISQTGCESFAHGFSNEGRLTFAGCLQIATDAGTCPTDVATCADDIRQ